MNDLRLVRLNSSCRWYNYWIVLDFGQNTVSYSGFLCECETWRAALAKVATIATQWVLMQDMRLKRFSQKNIIHSVELAYPICLTCYSLNPQPVVFSLRHVSSNHHMRERLFSGPVVVKTHYFAHGRSMLRRGRASKVVCCGLAHALYLLRKRV